MAFQAKNVMRVIQIEAALVRAERRVAFSTAWRADAAVQIVGHGDTCGLLLLPANGRGRRSGITAAAEAGTKVGA